MTIVIKSTEIITHIEGAPVRLWEGLTEDGTPCKVFVRLIAARADADTARLDAELRELPPPGLPVPLSFTL